MSNEPEDLRDQLAVLRAEMDQMLALAPELARAARSWFDAFKEQGFSSRQSLYLAAATIVHSPGEAPS